MKNILSIFALSLVLFSCEGPRGPVGPPGDNANSFDYTTINYTIKEQDWTPTADLAGWFATVNAPELNFDVLDYGFFLTYINLGDFDNPGWVHLPMTNIFVDSEGTPYSEEYLPIYGFNEIKIEFFGVHPEFAIRPKTSSFKTVVVSEPFQINALQKIDINDYNAVVNTLSSIENKNKDIRVE